MRSIVIHGHFTSRRATTRGSAPSLVRRPPRRTTTGTSASSGRATPPWPPPPSLSFDFGPTLLAWMGAPRGRDVRGGACRRSHQRGTAGRARNAIAMPYHHTSSRSVPARQETEVRWDRRLPPALWARAGGMWLPETAVDDETLDVLAVEGIRFTVLAPHQVERVPAAGARLASRRRRPPHRLFSMTRALARRRLRALGARPAAWIERLTPGRVRTADQPTFRRCWRLRRTANVGHHHRKAPSPSPVCSTP